MKTLIVVMALFASQAVFALQTQSQDAPSGIGTVKHCPWANQGATDSNCTAFSGDGCAYTQKIASVENGQGYTLPVKSAK